MKLNFSLIRLKIYFIEPDKSNSGWDKGDFPIFIGQISLHRVYQWRMSTGQ
jgi:hypothetical protein